MKLNLSLNQKHALYPQLIQDMKILQMGAAELREFLQEQIQENPVLEIDEHGPPGLPGERRRGKSPLSEKLEWLHSSDGQNRWYHQEDSRATNELAADRDYASQSKESLYDHLRVQIRFQELAPDMVSAVEYILQSLDGYGRLDESPEELAAHIGVSDGVIRQAIELVQSLEPAGVAARDLSECLALQLVRRGETGLPLTIVHKHLEDMGRSRYNHIAQLTGAGREEIRSACQLIRSLDPRPGADFATHDAPEYIIPDVTVELTGEEAEVRLNSAYIPSLHVSAYYHRLMDTTNDAEVRDYLAGKVQQANWVVQSIQQRQATLLSCANFIAEWQIAFFRKGPSHLHPLSLADAAAGLGIHPSTVSRAIRDKYLQCSYGVFPLKHFFSRALAAEGESPDVSAEQIKSVLRALLDGEDKKKPLSDQKLSVLMAEQGVQISRRTIAKYRDQLGIPPAAGRKQP